MNPNYSIIEILQSIKEDVKQQEPIKHEEVIAQVSAMAKLDILIMLMKGAC